MSSAVMSRAAGLQAERLAALVFVIPCVLCWALIPKLASDIRETGLDPFQFLFWSNLVSAIALFVLAWAKRRLHAFRLYRVTDLLYLGLLGGLGTFGYYVLLYSAYYAKAGKPAGLIIVQYTWPALTAVLSALVFRQRLTLRAQMALVLAILAIGVAFQPHDTIASPKAMVIVAIAAIMFAVYSVLSTGRSYEPFTYMTGVFVVGAILSYAWMVYTVGWAVPWRTSHAVLAVTLVLLNGLLVNGVSYVWWLEALRRAPASFVAPWASMTPLLGTSVLVLFRVPVDRWHWVGVGLILVSVLLSLPREPRSS